MLGYQQKVSAKKIAYKDYVDSKFGCTEEGKMSLFCCLQVIF